MGFGSWEACFSKDLVAGGFVPGYHDSRGTGTQKRKTGTFSLSRQKRKNSVGLRRYNQRRIGAFQERLVYVFAASRGDAAHFICWHRVPVQSGNKPLETGIKRGNGAQGAPTAKIGQDGPKHTKRFGCKSTRQIAGRATTTGEKLID